MTLNIRQQRFCEEFVIDKNATNAAIRAGYAKKSAEVTASKLLRIPKVSNYIGELAKKQAEKLDITAEKVLEEIAAMAFYDVGDLVEIRNGTKVSTLKSPRDIKKLPKNMRRIIKGWKYDRAGNFIVQFADKSKALDQLARHLSLYNDTLKVPGLDDLASRLDRAHKRVNAG